MHAHTGASRLAASPATTVCIAILLSGGAALAADTGSQVRQALQASIPRYDPAIREAHLAAQTAAIDAPHPIPPPAAPAPTPPPAPAGDILVLDPITVWGRPNIKPLPALPRLSFFAPLRDLPTDPLESPGARDARLIKKHLSALDQILNRFPLPYIGQSLAARARQAEAEVQRAQQLNALADAIELGTLLGQDPAITRKLRAEYLRLYYSGPK
jgi:hypothetical protein